MGIIAQFIGYLGSDPELKEVGDSDVCNFSLAVNFGQDNVEWYQVGVWGNSANSCAEYLKKGSQVAVIASGITSGAWLNDDGEIMSAVNITSYRVEFLGSRDDDGNRQSGGRQRSGSGSGNRQSGNRNRRSGGRQRNEPF